MSGDPANVFTHAFAAIQESCSPVPPARSAATVIRLARNVPRSHLAGLALLMLLCGLTEGIGLMLLVPLIGVVTDWQAGAVRNPRITEWLCSAHWTISLEGLLALFVALVALRSVIQFLRARAYAALMGAEWRWLAHTARSDLAHVLLSNIDRLGSGVSYAASLAAAAATLLAYLVVALWLSPWLSLIVAVTGSAVFAALAAQRRKALQLGVELTTSRRAMFAAVDQGLAGIKVTRILGGEPRHLARLSRDMDVLRRQSLAYSASLGGSRALVQLGAALLLALYIYFGLKVGQVPPAQLLVLIVLSARAVPMLMGVQHSLFMLLHTVPAMHEVERLLADAQQAAEPDAELTNEAPWVLAHELRLDHVSVTWPARERAALDRVSLTIPARTTVAVIGASGAGKSTLADVVMGLLLPDSGSMSVDGRAVTPVNRANWRRSVAYVPQEVFLFNDTIRANLAWGLPEHDLAADDCDSAAMSAALHKAGAQFVFDLPAGLDTPVGDNGVHLSGGERQRIALARVLLRRPALLLLDEATSALDTGNERRIRDTIDRLHGDMTVIVIGHRLPTLEKADLVIRLDQGRVAATGTWAQVGGLSGEESQE